MRDQRLAAIADQLLELAAELDAISVRGSERAKPSPAWGGALIQPGSEPSPAPRKRNRCRATNTVGRLCEHKAIKGTAYCFNHSAHRPCTGVRVNGEPCNALPMKDRDVCAYHAGLVKPPLQRKRRPR